MTTTKVTRGEGMVKALAQDRRQEACAWCGALAGEYAVTVSEAPDRWGIFCWRCASMLEDAGRVIRARRLTTEKRT